MLLRLIIRGILWGIGVDLGHEIFDDIFSSGITDAEASQSLNEIYNDNDQLQDKMSFEEFHDKIMEARQNRS